MMLKMRREARCFALLFISLLLSRLPGFALADATQVPLDGDDAEGLSDLFNPFNPIPFITNRSLAFVREKGRTDSQTLNNKISLANLFGALEVMQNRFFKVWLGTWPDSIDWTGAVLGTHISAALNSFTTSNYSLYNADNTYHLRDENMINNYFSHVISYYFGEDAFGIRAQAYDDMLWVVLGWLESIKFINAHNDKHFPPLSDTNAKNSTWYATDFLDAFAHRARIFWELAEAGWDEDRCGGGMNWSPYEAPYKNAITNELFIAASASMYLHFPGDDNDFPFAHPYKTKNHDQPLHQSSATAQARWPPHDKRHLNASIKAYDWLLSSDMLNHEGLFIDGFHLSNNQCTIPNKMLYTYNQGVLLTGQRYLWAATNNRTFLEHGHNLTRNAIRATGWCKISNTSSFCAGHEAFLTTQEHLAGIPAPYALGRDGILEEACDSTGTCDQNGQTFKGIFFHHLTTFCTPLPGREEAHDGIMFAADETLALEHLANCTEYFHWVEHNAQAARGTRNADGLFGGWWYPGSYWMKKRIVTTKPEAPLPVEGVDYRNLGVPGEGVWLAENRTAEKETGKHEDEENEERWQGKDELRRKKRSVEGDAGKKRRNTCVGTRRRDPNCRGRGRTVETQSGGVAVLRASHVFFMLLDQYMEKIEVPRFKEEQKGKVWNL